MKILTFKYTEVLLARGTKTLLFLIPFIPLYVSPSMLFPFITGKNFAFRILVELSAALWLSLVFINKKEWFRTSPMLIAILGFSFIVGLADLFGVNPYKSFWSNYERMEGYITILHLTLYFLIIKNIFKSQRDWKIFFSMILLASVLVSLFSFIVTLDENALSTRRHMMEYGTRAFSTLGNPPFLAAYLLIASFAGLLLAFQMQKIYLRLVCFMAVILNCAVIYMTATRGAILAAIAGVIMFVSVSVFGRSNKSGSSMLTRIVLLLLVVSIFISGVFFVSGGNEFVGQDQTLSRFTSMISSDSAKTRFDTWKMAWNGIKERPVLGWGQENFIAIYTVNPIPIDWDGVWIDRAHNIFIEWLINAGFIGFLSYLSIFGTALYILRKADREKTLSRNEVLIIFTAFVVYFIQNLFTFDTVNTYIIYFALLAYIDNTSSGEKRVNSDLQCDADPKKIISAMLVALLCFSFFFYYLNYRPIRQSRQIIQMSFTSPENDSYAQLLNEFNDVLSLNTFGDEYIRSGMRVVSNQILIKQYFDQKGTSELIGTTVKELEKGITLNRHNLEYLTNLISLLNIIAKYDKSYTARVEALINECMIMNPEYQWLNIAMADLYILKKDYESAFASVKKVADLNPEDDKSQFRLALMAIYASRGDDFIQILGKLMKMRLSEKKYMVSEGMSFLSLNEHYQLAGVYKEIRNYPDALQHLKEMINILSYKEREDVEKEYRYYIPKKTARIHLDIARIYLELDNKEAALIEAEKAFKMDGDLSGAKIIIDSINRFN
ncbi:MAG TPA: hypothetical protein ENG95_04855 [Nitrospirae bacterium]|nr:hypothetical protein [Nitrospirota bacterium]